ncbi:MAG: hypothetical protein RLZZ262_2237 [Bacteroidota bacterium]|jgi:hypothetical protein
MKTEQSLYREGTGWDNTQVEIKNPTFVLALGGIDTINKPEVYESIRSRYPESTLLFSSTAGEIHKDTVYDNSVSLTAVELEHTTIKVHSFNVTDHTNSFACGEAISNALNTADLKHILVLSDGHLVNGDELIQGINSCLPTHVVVTGGLAGDAGRFTGTKVGVNESPTHDRIVAVGFYGDRLIVTHGSQGGWDPFGPIRTVSKAAQNVLHELDGERALDVYKRYLGPKADELPGAALLFPLCILNEDKSQNLVRTILSIDEESGSMTFAGNIPEGAQVQFMMANFDRLVDGATEAAATANESSQGVDPQLILMISCVGRKIVLDQRIEEEVDAVRSVYGVNPTYTGFYSNGEISPSRNFNTCALHNQTMTITTYAEI